MRKELPKATEAETQAAILTYLNSRGHFAFRVNTQGVPLWGKDKTFRGFRPSPMKGVSDIIGIVGGVKGIGKARAVYPRSTFLAIECKAAGKKPTPEQDDFLEEVRKRGGIGIVARSIDDVQAVGL